MLLPLDKRFVGYDRLDGSGMLCSECLATCLVILTVPNGSGKNNIHKISESSVTGYLKKECIPGVIVINMFSGRFRTNGHYRRHLGHLGKGDRGNLQGYYRASDEGDVIYHRTHYTTFRETTMVFGESEKTKKEKKMQLRRPEP